MVAPGADVPRCAVQRPWHCRCAVHAIWTALPGDSRGCVRPWLWHVWAVLADVRDERDVGHPAHVHAYSPSATGACASCPAGKSTNGQDTQNRCECVAGKEPTNNAGDRADTCSSCKDNFFKPEWGLHACEACAPGYQTENGDFTQCVGVPCDPIQDIIYGDPESFANVRFPATIDYSCEPGFRFADGSPTSITCQTDGVWTELPQCVYDCGDGVVVEGEECDDGNEEDGDGSSSTCQLEDTHACIEPGLPCIYCNFTTKPQDLSLACTDPNFDAAVAAWAAVAGDADTIEHEHCGNVTFLNDIASTKGHYPNCYKRVYEFTASFNGGAADEVLTGRLRVHDDTVPTFDAVPEPEIAVECDAVPLANVTASDVCLPGGSNVDVSLIEVRTDGYCPHTYTLNRTWTADDGCGNTNSTRQFVEVRDTQPPVFAAGSLSQEVQCGANVTRQIDALLAANAQADVQDACSPTVSLSSQLLLTELSQCGGTGDARFVVNATDQCGLMAQREIAISIVDKLPPV